MEFKDELRRLRIEKGVSQRALAEAIFVSRSAVAKWENGLGLPSEDSYAALLAYFGIEREALPLHEEERAGVARRRRVHTVFTVLLYAVTVFVILAPLLIYRAYQNGFSFSEQEAIGANYDVVLHTEQYVICYDIAQTEDGSRAMAMTVKFLRRVPLGYRLVDPATVSHDVYYGEQEIGRVYVIEDGGRYYYLYRSHIYLPAPEGLPPLGIGEVTVDGKPMEEASPALFVSDRPLSSFVTEGREYQIVWEGAP